MLWLEKCIRVMYPTVPSFSCIGSPIRPHIFMFDRFTGKFIRTIGKSGQGPGEMYSPVNVVAKDSLVYLSSDYRDELFVYKIKTESL